MADLIERLTTPRRQLHRFGKMVDKSMSDLPSMARSAKGWALYTRTGWIFTESVRRRRREVVQYANMDAAPGWNWAKYRKNGFFIAKVDIVPIAPTNTGERP